MEDYNINNSWCQLTRSSMSRRFSSVAIRWATGSTTSVVSGIQSGDAELFVPGTKKHEVNNLVGVRRLKRCNSQLENCCILKVITCDLASKRDRIKWLCGWTCFMQYSMTFSSLSEVGNDVISGMAAGGGLSGRPCKTWWFRSNCSWDMWSRPLCDGQ